MGGTTSDKVTKPKPSGAPAKVVMPRAVASGRVAEGIDVALGDVTGPQARLPERRPSPQFLLAVHPDRWVAGLDGRVLPNFARITVRGGVEGQESSKGGVVNWRTAANRYAAMGYTVIPHGKGPRGRSYMQAVKVRGGGVAHVTCFETLYEGSRSITCDRGAIEEWVATLLASGDIEQPSLVGLYRELQRAERMHAQAADKSASSFIMKRRADEFEKTVEALRTKIAELEGLAHQAPVEGSDATLD